MVNIEPFSAYYYNTEKVRLSDVIVPPFDVISESERKRFSKRHPYNFVKIILGKERGGGYQRAGELFQLWKKKNILIRDTQAHFYFWQQTFREKRKRLTRSGLVAEVALDGFRRGDIVPHEKTFEAPILDRLQVVEATRANLSPVFMMYDGGKMSLENKIIQKCGKPFLQFHDLEGVKSRIWKIEERDLEKEIQNYFQNKKLYIVDGHHRFATALAFREKHKQTSVSSRSPVSSRRKPGSTPLDFVLTVICNMADPALSIYPIHRMLLRQKDFDREAYLKRLASDFVISKKRGMPKVLKRKRWGILFHHDPVYYELSPKRGSPFFKKAKEALDVFILQESIIPKKYRDDLRYTKAIGKNLEREFLKLREGKYEAIWLTREPSLDQIKAIADAHEVMPQKSTFFYPKIFAGALIRCFD